MKINKLSFVAALAVGGLVACATLASAQDSTAPKGRRGPSPQQQVERMSTELNLTADQKTKVTSLLEDQAKKAREMRQDTSLSQEDRRDKMRSMREETDKKLKDILTPDQYQKWQKMREDMRNRRGGNGEKKGESSK